MYSALRRDNVAQRGTGIFYQALPGIAADGRNIMTLIPVQKINGKYVQSQVTKPKTQKAIPPNVVSAPVPVRIKPAVTPITTKQIAGNQVSVVNALPCQHGVAGQGLQQDISLNTYPLQTVESQVFLRATEIQAKTVSATHVCSGIKKPLLISSTNSLSSSHSTGIKKPLLISSTNSLSSSHSTGIKKPLLISSTNNLSSLPLAGIERPLLISTTNSLSSSHSTSIKKSLLISSTNPLSSSHSTIKKPLLISSTNSLSSSHSTGINKPLLLSSTNSFSSSNSTSVEKALISSTVSSKSTVSRNNESSYVSELENLCSTSHTTSPSLGPPKSRLKLIPKVSQRPNSPMKWVIEEVGSNESAVDLPRSPSVPSKTFQTLDSGNKFGVLEKATPVSLSGLTTSEPHHQPALVMCDGRVFFSAKKDALSSSVGINEKSCHLKNSTVPSSSSSLLQHARIMAPMEPSEVIDLCSDENPDDLCQTQQTDPPLDEDNVIFVSYIPPKAKNAPTQSVVEKTPETETNITSARTLDHVTERETTPPNCSDTAHDQRTCSALDGRSIDRSQNPDDSVTVRTVATDDRDSVMSSQDTIHKRQLDSLEVSPGMESLSHSNTSGLTCGKSPDKEQISSNAPPACKLSDHFLRQHFGVTADVRICLQRMNPGCPVLGLNKPAQKGPTKNIEESTSLLKERELFMQYSYIPQDPDRSSCPVDIKRTKLSDEQNSAEEVVASSTHAGIDSVKCSLLKRKTKCPSGRSSPKTIFCDLDTEQMVGYVEPIDDDILFSDENDTPNSQDSAAQSLNSARSNTSRMGRARKRTMCPCCVPGTSGLALTTRTRVEFSQRITWTRDHASKRSARMQKLK
ncbi:uncharacterized protein lrif1 isoform X1 [Vanacampus margaritifer]